MAVRRPAAARPHTAAHPLARPPPVLSARRRVGRHPQESAAEEQAAPRKKRVTWGTEQNVVLLRQVSLPVLAPRCAAARQIP